MNVVVIGGGPAGILAGISASEQGNQVTILEKMNTLGKKLCITGKGRCNITSSLPIDEFIKNIPGNGKFLYSAFKNFTNKDFFFFCCNVSFFLLYGFIPLICFCFLLCSYYILIILFFCCKSNKNFCQISKRASF